MMIDFSSSAELFVDPKADTSGINADGETIRWPQIVINNLSKHAQKNDITRYVNSMNIPIRKLKVVPCKTFCFVVFNNKEDMEKAIAFVNVTPLKSQKLEAVERSFVNFDDRDRVGDKRKRDDSDGGAEVVREVSAKKAACPWYDVEYSEQLVRKQDEMWRDCVSAVVKEIKKAYNNSGKGNNATIADNQWVRELRAVNLCSTTENSNSTPIDVAAPSSVLTMQKICASESVLGYRNKCEFTFGFDGNGNQTCGFRCSSYEGGTCVAPPYDCINVPNAMKLVVHKLLTFTQGNAAFDVYDPTTKKGVLRLLTVRYSKRTKQLVVMFCLSLRDFRGSAGGVESWLTEMKKLAVFLSELKRPVSIDNESLLLEEVASAESSADPLITGCLVQVFEGLTVPASDHPVISIFGTPYVTEILNTCSFRVSPQSFFQVNTSAAECLYRTAIDQLQAKTGDSQGSCILDVCCGTGTIGICASVQLGLHSLDAESTEKTLIIGIDNCAAAIENAGVNAELNNVKLVDQCSTSHSGTIASFICSRAETVMEDVLGTNSKSSVAIGIGSTLSASGSTTSSSGDISASGRISKLRSLLQNCDKYYAIVDPPREGLHPSCLKAIRTCPRIERLVYISCNPTKSLVKDSAVLCGEGKGKPFRPVNAIPIDLFPHTPHCEMIMIFER